MAVYSRFARTPVLRCRSRRAAARSIGFRGHGFTLVEIMVVLALVALVVTITAVSLGQGLTGSKVRAASRDLAAALRYTRGQAIVTQSEQVLELDLEHFTYTAPKRKAVELPKDMELRLLTAQQELTGDKAGRIRFYADGSSTGGRIKVVRGRRSWDIEVAWLTGEVALREGEATP
ncbi:MAG TPA: GspH/FimT family pseudopilin [Xanthomonadales bacterium]|nr:GspH/FimT family pseudopilin [Xanthomonadales bacterium]